MRRIAFAMLLILSSCAPFEDPWDTGLLVSPVGQTATEFESSGPRIWFGPLTIRVRNETARDVFVMGRSILVESGSIVAIGYEDEDMENLVLARGDTHTFGTPCDGVLLHVLWASGSGVDPVWQPEDGSDPRVVPDLLYVVDCGG